MQQRLFMERFDGTIPFKKKNDANEINRFITYLTLEGFRNSFQELVLNEYDGFDITYSGGLFHQFLREKGGVEFAKMITTYLEQDHVQKQSCVAYTLYKEAQEKKNFIVSRPLTKCLSKIKLDIPVKSIIKDNFRSYFEFTDLKDDDNFPVQGCFVNIYKDDAGNRFLALSAIAKATTDPVYWSHEAMTLYISPKDENKYKTLEELFIANKPMRVEARPEYVSAKTGKPLITYNNDSLLTGKVIRTMLNALLYVTNPNEKFKEQYNEFAKKKSKAAGQKRQYTEHKFCKIGYGEDTEFLKMLVTKSTDVDPYWRTQHYGPKNTLTKYILVSGYTRKQQAYIDK